MRRAFSALATAFVIMGISVASADDIDTARKCVSFWTPFEGTWQSTTNGEASVWRTEKSPSGLCYVSSTKVGEEVVGNGIHAYDPETKCWKVVGFRVPTDTKSWLHRTTWIHVDMESLDQVRAGVSGSVEAKQTRADGTVVEEKGKIVVDEISRGKIVYRIIERTEDGAAKDDLKVVMERQ